MSNQPTDETPSISELAERRVRTEAVSGWIRQRLEQHLEILRPAFDPRRLLGRHAGSSAARDDVRGADAAMAQLSEHFRAVCGSPFTLRNELPPEVVAGIDRRLELYPFEYPHVASDGREPKTIRITSPLRWVLSYASDYTLAQIDRALAKQEERRESDLRQFVVNALVMSAMLEKFPPLRQILGDLRFEISTATRDGLGKLPRTERFREKVVCTQPHGLNGQRYRSMPCDDDYLRSYSASLVQFFQDVEAAHLGHANIQQNQIIGVLCRHIQSG